MLWDLRCQEDRRRLFEALSRAKHQATTSKAQNQNLQFIETYVVMIHNLQLTLTLGGFWEVAKKKGD